MNKRILLWLALLGGAFLVSAAFDAYLQQTRADPDAATHAAKVVSMTEFLDAVRAGTLRDGKIAYRAQVDGLADLIAHVVAPTAQAVAAGQTAASPAPSTTKDYAAAVPAAALLRTTGRLTEPDLRTLREARFLEGDLAILKPAPTEKTVRDYVALGVHGSSQGLGVLFLICGGVVAVQAIMAKNTSFSPKAFRPATSDVKFASVAGCNEAKEEVSEIVEFLKNPERFNSTGGRMPKGVLLVGPPGTGKTMLAKAVAGEANAKFYSLSGSDFVELYVGVGASRVRSLFKKARENAPSIIFIDEIDAVGRQRASGVGGHQEHEQTLNALLVAMDGFDSDDAVVVFGATNRPEIMDKALLRPGRFDRQVFVGLPDLRGRADILKVHAGSVKLDASVSLEEVAKTTSGFSGADLANLINEGALHAARRQHPTVLMRDLDEARDKISWGRERRRTMSDADKKIIAYHEAGHALLQVLSCDGSLKLHKVTIIPRGQSLGSTQFTPERDLLNYSKEQLVARIQCLMAGRVAEELALGSITSGASGDIQEASRLARQMVFEWGMSPFGFLALSSPEREGTLGSQQMFYEAERYVKTLLEEQYALTTERLRKSRAALDAIAVELITRETISGEDVRRLAFSLPALAAPAHPLATAA